MLHKLSIIMGCVDWGGDITLFDTNYKYYSLGVASRLDSVYWTIEDVDIFIFLPHSVNMLSENK